MAQNACVCADRPTACRCVAKEVWRVMADPGAGPSEPPLPDPSAEFLRQRAGDACDEEFFQCGAVDLASSLLGQCLYFHDSQIAVRILETEAYPADDAVYDLKFRNKQLDIKELFKIQGGTPLTWSPGHYSGGEADLYITAGSANTGDMVLIRSCEPVLGLEEILKRRKNPTSRNVQKNLLIGPRNVAEGLGAGIWQIDPILYRPGGAQLFRQTREAGERVKRGKRILATNIYYGCPGTEALYRFALITKNKYRYSTKCGGLQDWEA